MEIVQINVICMCSKLTPFSANHKCAESNVIFYFTDILHLHPPMVRGNTSEPLFIKILREGLLVLDQCYWSTDS